MNCISLLFIIIFGLSVNAHADIPQISLILPQETREDIAVSIPFRVTADSEIVSVALASSNQVLVPNEYLQYASNANHYTLVATPSFNQTGSTIISMTVTDLESNTQSTQFELSVDEIYDDSVYYWNNYQEVALEIKNVFNYPAAVALDSTSGKIFVSDTGNHRVLRFSKNDTTISEVVFGDSDSYTMDEPMGIHVDPFGRLWVADTRNHRVLRFDRASTKPDRAPPDGILGKAEFSEYSKTSQDAMSFPADIWLDPTGTLWVADSENNRILRFDQAAQKENYANADGVLGQPDFINKTNGLSQSKMTTPLSIVGHQGHLYVADHLNNRVLCFKNVAQKNFLANADYVLGQPNFDTNEKKLSATGMDLPSGLAIDAQGRLYVSEQDNNRVLIFDNVVNQSNGHAANNVLGQIDFVSNDIVVSNNSLFGPYVLNFDAVHQHLWVPDLINNRVVRFDLNRKQTPSLGFIHDQTINENTTSHAITFTVTDNNAQSLTITYDFSNKNLLSSDSFAFSGPTVTSENMKSTVFATSAYTYVHLYITPEFEQFGATTVTITVTDPHGLQDTQTFALNVLEVNDAPTITPIDNQTIIEDAECEAIHFTVADIEGKTLHIEVSDDSQDLFPANAKNITLSNDNGGDTWQLTTDKDTDVLTLLLRPALNRSGTSTLTVTVSDGVNKVHTHFLMIIEPQNDPPMISLIDNQTTDEDIQSSAIPFTVFDPDATQLTITVVSGNHTLIPSDTQHLTLTNALGNSTYTLTTDPDNDAFTLYVRPSTNQSGASVITLTATDGVLSSSQSFTMTVLPVNDTPTISSIANQSTIEETLITDIVFSVDDIDTTILFIEIISSSPDVIPSDAHHVTLCNEIGETGYTLLANSPEYITLSLMPAPNISGSTEITVRVTGGSSYATRSFTATVIPINDPPVISKIADQYALEDMFTIIPFAVNDPDADPVTITIATGNDLLIPSNASHLTFQTAKGQFTHTMVTIPGGEPISLTVLPLLNQSGKTAITIVATDGIEQVSSAFIMSITGVNDPPFISMIENQTFFEDTESNPIKFTVSDIEFDSLTIAVASTNSVLIPSDTNHITLSNATGHHSYTLATHAGDHLNLTLLPSLNLFGSSIISITVTDGALMSSQSFTITVEPVNDAPMISPIANLSIHEDMVSPNILFSVADPESDFLTIEIQSNNEDLIATHSNQITLQNLIGGNSYTLATHPGALTLVLLANHNQVGHAEIDILATDGFDVTVSSFTVTVVEVNDLPMISFIPDQTTLEDTQSAEIAFKITDVDANHLTISIQPDNINLLPLDADHITLCHANEGKTYTLLTYKNSEHLSLTVLPSPNQTGDVSITVQVADGYSSVAQSFTLSIDPVNDPPVILPIADHSAYEDMLDIQIPFTAFDFEDPACSLGITLLSSDQTRLADDHIAYSCFANMYTMVVQPAQHQNGSLRITLIVTDQDGVSTTSNFGFALTPVNDSPVIHAPAQVRVKKNVLISILGIHIEDCDAGNEPLAITLVTDEGTLMMPIRQGTSLAFTGTISDINSELETVAYSPTNNTLGLRTLTINVNDLGHSGEGGMQISSSNIAIQIHDDNVKPINYLPTLTMKEDESLHITPISVFDLDAANNPIEVTLTTKHGALTIGETESITLLAGSFVASTQIVLSGSQYNINHALEHLMLTCTTHFNGWAALTMTTNDLGHSGKGYSPQTATQSVPITVLATIDPPTHLLPKSITLFEDIATPFTACVIDPDGEDTIFVALEVNTGIMQLNSGKGLTGFLGNGNYLSFFGKKSDVNFAMQGMTYQPDANVSGNYTFTMTYKDNDFASHSASIPLRITAINDPPNVYVTKSAITIDEDTALTLSCSVSDIEAGDNNIQVFLDSHHSLLQVNQINALTAYPSNMAQSLTLTGAIRTINQALDSLIFMPTKNYYGKTYVSIKVDDLGFFPLPAESTQKTISITINPLNDPPDFVLTPDTIVVHEDFSTPQIITFTTNNSVFGEPSQVTYTLTPEPESITWAAITFVPEFGMITITAIENRHGSAQFVVSADDGQDENNIATRHFSITITSVNDPPEFVLSKHTMILYEDFTTIESISLTPGVIPDDEPKTITYTLQPESLTWTNLSIDSETGQISVTAIPNGHGDAHISVIANDGAITATHDLTITVLSINDVPQITSQNFFSISENTAIGTTVHRINATDADHHALIYSIDSIMPSEAFGISQHTGDIWVQTPLDYETIHHYTMSVSVSDPITTVYQNIFASIADINDAPIIFNIPQHTQTTFKNEPFNIVDMSVSDVDARSQPIQLTLMAENGVVSITHSLLTLESGNYSTSSLSVSGTITAINLALTAVYFSPNPEYQGPANLFIEINDQGHSGPGTAHSVSASISIYVLNYNVPPVFEAYTPYQLCFEDQPLTQTIVISDEDAIDEAIQLTLISEHGSLTLSNLTLLHTVFHSQYTQSYTGCIQEMNAALKELIFIPEKEFSGIAGYTLYANDLGHSGIGGPKDAEPAVITINCIAVNDPPVHSLPAGVTGLEETAIPLTITVSDIDAYTHVIHVQLDAFQGILSLSHIEGLTIHHNNAIAETSLSLTGTIDTINKAMSPIMFHPANNFFGLAGLQITSNDLGFSGHHGQSDAKTETDLLTITVININDSPEINTSPLQFINEDSVYTYTIGAGDIDGDHLSFTVTTLPDWLTLTDFGNNTAIIQGTPKNDHVGISAALTIVATDPSLAQSFQTFTIVVNNTNDPPSFQSVPIEQATEDSLYQYTISTIDIDREASLTIKGNQLPDWLQLKDGGDGNALLYGTPEHDDVAQLNVVILSVSDGIELIKQSFIIDVINTNDPPEIISSPVDFATEDSLYNSTITANDMDGDAVSFIATALPDWLSLVNIGENKAVIQGIPRNQHVGCSETLIITAQDPFHATAAHYFAITVTNTNDPPKFSSIPITEATEDSLYVYTITVLDIDIDASIRFQSKILSEWLILNDHFDGTATISGIPRNEHVGIQNAAVILATDGIAKEIEQKFMITVTNTNDPPSFVSTPIMTATEDRQYSYTIIAEDMDGDILNFSSEALPQWLTLTHHHDNTATLQGIPKNEHVGGSKPFTMIASDPGNVTSVQTFSITVSNVNDRPVFVSLPNISALEDNLYMYTITVQDVDIGASLTINAASIPHWLSFTDFGNGNAVLMGIPLNEDVYKENKVVLTASDGIAPNISQEFLITVVNTNDAPVISSQAVLTATEDSPYVYTIVANDIDGDLLRFSTETPSWLTLIDYANNSATLEGIPENDDVGVSSITITTIDPSSATASQHFEIQVINTNDAPIFSSLPIQNAIEDQIYSYTLTVLDVDGDAIQIGAVHLPEWLTLIDEGNNTALLTGTPLNDHVANKNPVVITATDGLTSPITQTFSINVSNTNDIPEITSAAVLIATEDAFYEYTITGIDIDGDPLFFQAHMPSWLTLVNYPQNMATLIGIPTNDDVGQSSPIILTAMDPDNATATQTFYITVKNTNDAPSFTTVPSVSILEDSAYTYTLQVQDIDKDANIYMYATSIPNWLTFVNIEHGIASLTGIPENEHVGDHSIIIAATDHIAENIFQAFTITVVNTNDPPIITTRSLPSVDEDSYYETLLTGDDMDGDTFIFSASSLPSWLSLSNYHDNEGRLHGMPKNDDIGLTEPFTIIVTDPDGATATRSFSIVVNNTNDAPTFISTPKINISEDSLYSHTFQVVDIDPDPTINISALHLPDWLTITDNGDGTAIIFGTPLNENVGDHEVAVIASDGIAQPVTRMFTIQVANTNDPPIITSRAIQTVDEDTSYLYQITGDDMDGDQIKYIATGLPSWLELIDNHNRTATLVGIPTNNDVGQTDIITMMAIDPDHAIATQSFRITVNNINDLPTFQSQPKIYGIEDITYTYSVRVEDIDDDALLTIQASTKPSWLALTDNGDGTALLTGKPLNAHVGNNAVILDVTDGFAPPVSQAFTIWVANTNDAPVITSTSTQLIYEDSLYTYELFAEDIDPNDNLHFVVESLPEWLSFYVNDDHTALLQGTPENQHVGESSLFTLTVIDTKGASDQQSFTIQVLNTNDYPEISTIPSQNSLEYKTTSPFLFTVHDIDGDPLSIHATSSDTSIIAMNSNLITFCAHQCKGESIQLSATNTIQPISLTILPIRDGVAGITITVADAELSASTSFILTVTNVNIPPQMGHISDTAINEDTSNGAVSFTVVDEDCDSRGVTVTVITDSPLILPNSPQHLSINEMGLMHHFNASIPVPLHLWLRPMHNQSGLVGITVTVIDADGDSDVQHFKLTVNQLMDDPPEVSMIENISIAEDTVSYKIDLRVMDPDGGNLKILVQSSHHEVVPSENIICSPSYLSATSHVSESLTLTIHPIPDKYGDVKITIFVTDEQDHVSETSFLMTVTPVNDTPLIFSDISSIKINEDTANYPLSFTIADADGDRLTLHVISSHPQLISQSDINFQQPMPIETKAGIQKNIDMTLSTQNNAYGTAQITIIVTDTDGLENRFMFEIEVDPINDPPYVSSITPQFIREGALSAPIDFTISDIDSNQLVIQAHTDDSIALPTSCVTFAGHSSISYTVNISSGEPKPLTLILFPPTDINKLVHVQLTVYDRHGLNHSISFPVTIEPVNDMPEFDLNFISLDINEDAGPQFRNDWISHISTGALNEDDDLSFIVQTNNAHLFEEIPHISIYGTTGTLLFTPASDVYGTALVGISLSDGYSTTTEKKFEINIISKNDPPVLTIKTTNCSTFENQPFSSIPFNLGDIDSKHVTISLLADHQFFSEISICSGIECHYCTEKSCEFQFEKTLPHEFITTMIETLKLLTNFSEQWKDIIQDIDSNEQISLSEAIYYIQKASANRFSLYVRPQGFESGNQSLILKVSDGSGGSMSQSISFSVTPVSTPPELIVENCEGEEDELIPLPIQLELVDQNSETLQDILISGLPVGANLNKGIKNSGIWVLKPEDLSYLLISPATNRSDNFTLTVTASSKENSLAQKASVTKAVQINVIPVADPPILELETTQISGQVGQNISIVFKKLNLTDTDGSEIWDRIEIVNFSSDLQFSKGTTINEKLIIDLSDQQEMDLSGWQFSVKSTSERTYSFVLRVFSKETENMSRAISEVQVNLSVTKQKQTASDDSSGGCFLSIMRLYSF